MIVEIREPTQHNETEDARRHREAVEQYIRHSQREQKARVEGDARYLEFQILMLEKALREFDAQKAGGEK